MGPEYISDLLAEYKQSGAMSSFGGSQLVDPPVRTKQGENAFRYYADGVNFLLILNVPQR